MPLTVIDGLAFLRVKCLQFVRAFVGRDGNSTNIGQENASPAFCGAKDELAQAQLDEMTTGKVAL